MFGSNYHKDLWVIILGFLFLLQTGMATDPLPAQDTEHAVAVSRYWLMPQVSVVMPTSLILKNKNFDVPYYKQFPSLSQFGVALVTPLKMSRDLELLGVGKIAFSYKEGNYQFNRRTNGEAVNSRLKLFWLPILVGGKVQYTIPAFPHVKPSVTLGGGIHWLYQTGSLGGLNSSFWVPYFQVTPALSFFEGRDSDDWFGGFTFGVSYQSSFSSAQTVRGWSFDMGLNIVL